MTDGWHLYLLRCRDGSMYAGITTDIERRFRQHTEGKGAKYTRSHRPVHLVYFESFATKEEALAREAAIKKLTRAAKLALIDTAEKRNYNK